MKLRTFEVSLLACVALVTASAAPAPSAPSKPQIPSVFVENRGQADSAVRYIFNGPHFSALFDDFGVVFRQGMATTRVSFEGGQRPFISPSGSLEAKANYLHGNDRAAWQTGLTLWKSLHYYDVWPGVEIRFQAGDAEAKTEYAVSPGASVDSIRLRFRGKPTIGKDGVLTVETPLGEFREQKPVIFQGEETSRRQIEGGFRQFQDGTIGFEVKDYDRTKTLIVDPAISFSGYFGGNAQSSITSVQINSYYNTIVAGWTLSANLPASTGAKPRNSGGVDAFVAGFNPSGALLFCTYLGGSGDDRALGIAVDAANNTYITGQTSSTNFPVMGGVQSKLKGARDAFVVKLNPAGNALIYSTYLGGTGVDVGNAIVVDDAGSAFVAGDTTSTNLPVTAGTFQPRLAGSQDGFVAKLAPTGAGILWMTYYGGTGSDHAAALKQDSAGCIFLVGSTYSVDFPTLQAFQPGLAGGQDGFVSKIAPDGTAIMFSTYIGGSGGTAGSPEVVNAVSLGTDGNLMIAGTTSSPDFPVTPPVVQATYGGGLTDGFIARLSQNTGALYRSMFVGGSGDDGITGMVADLVSNIFCITGYTSSSDFPSANATQRSIGGTMDAFVAKIGFSRIFYVSYLGGTGGDAGAAIAVDSFSNMAVGGSTGSTNFPVAGSLAKALPAPLSSFITRLSPNFTLALAHPPLFYFDVLHDSGYNGPNGNLNVANFGIAGDVPLMGDWVGSGVKQMGVFRNGTWILDTNSNNVIDVADKVISFGQPGDVPLLGDWNGTGRIKLGLFRQGTFILDLSGHLSGAATGLSDVTFALGLPGDLPIVADWNGSGTTKTGVFRSGQWLIDFNGSQTVNKTYTYGQAGDVPLVGDWASSGIPNQIGVFRHGFWILNGLGNNSMVASGQYEFIVAFGSSGFSPLVY